MNRPSADGEWREPANLPLIRDIEPCCAGNVSGKHIQYLTDNMKGGG
jgi:hypothetical protein